MAVIWPWPWSRPASRPTASGWTPHSSKPVPSKRALVVFTQADVSPQSARAACSAQERSNCDAYAGLRQQLRQRAHEFAGMPVLLVHGDTHPYCWDKGFGGTSAPNLWRLNAWGDFQQPADATEISVQPDNQAEPFSARTLLKQIRPGSQCS